MTMVVLLPAAVTGAAAATPEELFETGNAAYKDGHFEEAAKAYGEILAFGIADPRAMYNLGNTYFKMNRLGPAILQYERALRLAPADQEIRDNLALARGQIRDRITEPELQYPIRVVKDTIESLPAGPVAWTFLVLWSAAGGLLGAVPLASGWGRRRALALGAMLVGTLALTAGASSLYQLRMESEPIAIVQEDKVDVRSGPGEENTVLFTVHEGARVQLGNHLDHWVQVSLPNGLSGWVPSTAIEKV
jgi:tetratricopeptide (TPR) repeat protein